MRVKVYSGILESTLEGKINGFLERPDIELVEIQFRATAFGVFALILYKQKV